MRWSIVVPTKVGWPHLEITLPPLLAALGASDEVVIVGDGNHPCPGRELDPRCRALEHRGEAGFAPVCNRGAAAARGATLLFLNDDVVVTAGVLDALERALAAPGVGAVGPDVVSDALGRSESGTSLRWRHGVLESRQEALGGAGEVEVPYLCGAALAIRRRDFFDLGGFDERLAPYFWEDVDLSLRTRARIGRTVVVSGATVRHRHGATVNAHPERARRAAYERNRLLVSWRNLHGWRWATHFAWLPLRVAAGLAPERGVAKGFLLALRAVRRGGSGDARRG